MQILTTINLIVRRLGVFAVVLAILAVVARVEPQREETRSYPLLAKIVKPKPASNTVESTGWIKGLNPRRRG